MSILDLSPELISLLSGIRQLVSDASSLESLQQGIVEILSHRFPCYSWTGFYMLDPRDSQTLILGPFAGEPTPHVRIPVSQGICGAAAASGETVIVDDVNADPRYLSCSIKTKSEIVVPIHAHGTVVGEIDIDSHTPAAFTDIDRLFLEETAGIVASYMESHSAACGNERFFAEDAMSELEEVRTAELYQAQTKAQKLFDEIEARGLIRSAITESRLNEDIYALAKEMYGITTYWHKRIVRAGKNTLLPYAENPPDLTVRSDDILFLDLGPVFEAWEADFGRTFVLGSDPLKHKLRQDVGLAFAAGKRYFEENPDILSNELYAYAQALAEQYGWEFGGPIAGHLIGQFPHERIAEDKVTLYVHPGSRLRMRSLDEKGQKRHWILEIHFVNKEREIGGFYEELLTVG